ncbi:hypothetical protein D3C85_1266550 [compost metagenome]
MAIVSRTRCPRWWSRPGSSGICSSSRPKNISIFDSPRKVLNVSRPRRSSDRPSEIRLLSGETSNGNVLIASDTDATSKIPNSPKYGTILASAMLHDDSVASAMNHNGTVVSVCCVSESKKLVLLPEDNRAEKDGRVTVLFFPSSTLKKTDCGARPAGATSAQ